MGRAPNPGGPQRVTAHVVPRAKPYPDGDRDGEEEEKTTIESGWEDEASTTVEQGDAADKLLADLELPRRPQQPGTGITHTGAVDEPTVDDQHAPVLSAITPLRQEHNARLSITQGNDTGQTFEIRPGKSYTVGRAIDNDIVLTDIAVSRKHFDLRFEDGSWVIVDRGSGNGTVVNGNVEDNPFMLASSDMIEIGNTVFRFEQENATAASRPRQNLDPLEDDEELSTVAGKPVRGDVDEDEPRTRLPTRDRVERPKTLPPPLPMRNVPQTQPPPLGLPPQVPQPASTLPLPQMANRPPPSMLGGDPLGSMPLPTTLPGQPMPPRPAYPVYPQATEIPPHSVHAQMLLIQTQNRRGDGSTMHVPPTPFDGMVAAPQPNRFTPAQLSNRAKLIFAGASLAALAAILTIAIVSSDGKSKAAAKDGPGEPVKNAPTIEPIKSPDPVAKVETPDPVIQKVETPQIETPQIKVEKKIETPQIKVEKKVEPKRLQPKRIEPKRVDPKKVVEQPKREPKRVATADSSSSNAKTKADALYKSKKFNDASSVLANAARSASGDDARELKKTSEYYAGLGKAMNAGMAPGTDAVVAFENLRRASNYDRNVGGFFDNDIQTKLAQVAPKAAFSYYAKKNYQAARIAVIAAEQYGNGDGVAIVRQKLESVARDLYNDAQTDNFQSSNSKDKLKQIRLIVDSKSPWYQKATKALGT